MNQLLPTLLLATPLLAQTTHLVGPGALPQIRDALAIAAPGDVILVQGGTYAHFTATVGVTIRALVPGAVFVHYDPAYAPPGCLSSPLCAVFEGPTRFQLPLGQTAHVVDLTFQPNQVATTPGLYARHRVQVNGGMVTFDGCRIEAGDDTALAVTGASVELQDTIVASVSNLLTGHGLFANGSTVNATGCTFRGSTAFGISTPGDGIQLSASTLVGSNLQVLGGLPVAPFGTIGGAAVRADSTSKLWLADSTLNGGGTTCALIALPTSGRIDRSTVSPTGGSCTVLPAGLVVGVSRTAPLQNGATFVMHVRTDPTTLVAIHASLGLAPVTIPGLFEQPAELDLANFWLAGLFVSDGNGDVTASWNMPAGMFVDTPVWLETISIGASLPIQIGPVVGGIIR